MKLIKREHARGADFRIHERDIFFININHHGIVSACRRIEHRVPIHDDGQFLFDDKRAQVIKCACGVLYFHVKSIGAERILHSFMGSARNARGARNFAKSSLRFAYAEILQHHLEADRAAIGVLMGDGAELDHIWALKGSDLRPSQCQCDALPLS